jgi:MFS family permease
MSTISRKNAPLSDARFIGALAAITLIWPLSIHIFLPVMPVVKSVFGISDALAGLSFSVSLFVMAFANLLYGSLSDRYGRRPVLLSGLFLFTLGSAVSAMAQSVSADRRAHDSGARAGAGVPFLPSHGTPTGPMSGQGDRLLTMAYTRGP